MNEQTSLIDFLLHHTQVGELCVVREQGWVTAAVYIDHEDLFSVPERIAQCSVQSDSWSTFTITDEQGNNVSIPCHYIDI